MGDFPTGTVTFLFTDIEGSTRLLRQLRHVYGQVLSEHRRLLRGVFSANNGHVVDMQGDAFFVVFDRARDAVVAATAGQVALDQNQWPEGVEVRVRMGVHTGEAFLSDEGYLGLAVHRAARICSAGHGGHVLVSQTTAALLEDEDLAGMTLRDAGEHNLKDLDRVERIYQAVIEGFPDDPRSVKALEEQPVKATPFAGQERDLAVAAQAAMSPRRRLSARVRESLARPPGQWRRAAALFAEAVWDASRGRTTLVALAAVVAASFVISFWLLAIGAAVYAYHVFATVRAVRFFHSVEGVGWKVHSIAHIAPDNELHDEFLELAGALVRAGRLAKDVDAFLSRADKRAIAHRLSEVRATSASSAGSLASADALAHQLRSIQVLIDRRQALGEETRRVDLGLASIRERTFDARLDGRVPEDLRDEVAGFAQKTSLLGASLGAAFLDAKRAGPTPRAKKLRSRTRVAG